jgi:hypothetical protein
MANIIDMQDMRHLNLFAKITKVRTRFCFTYNEILMFCVPKPLVSKALGKEGINLKKISEIVKRRIRIIPSPRGVEDIRFFIQAIINPAVFKDLEVKNGEVIITAGGVQNKATLLGRNKRRFEEMKKIIKNFFGLEYKVV